MYQIDQALQQRVWQRVRLSSEAPLPGPEGLLLEERTDEAQLLQMGQRELASQAGERIAALRGICRIAGIPEGTLRPKPPIQADNVAWRSLLNRMTRRHRVYAQLAGDPDFGLIYDALSGMIGSACLLLAKRASPLRNSKK